jgi:uncharacterized repeat protein (TIGR01451 family)
MPIHPHRFKLLVQILMMGTIATGIPLLSIEAARASDVLFNFKIGNSGTAPFDSDNNPGHDANDTNNIVRTQDIITYKWEYNISNGTATNVILSAIVPDNVEITLPPVCTTGSQITTDPSTGSQTIICAIGDLPSGSSGAIDLKARVLGQRRAPSNAFVGNGDKTKATGSISVDNASTTFTPIVTSDLIISAVPKTDLSKQAAYVEGAAKGEDGVTDGIVIRYPILLSLTGGGKGGEALVGNISFTDTLVYNGGSKSGQPIPGAKLYTWRPSYNAYVSLTPGSNSSCNRMGGDPWAYYGGYPNGKSNSSYYAVYSNPDWSTTDSGTWTCSQPGGAGTPIQLNITGADTTGNRAPIKDYYGGTTLPADQSYLVVGAMHVWVPVSSITANTGQTAAGQVNVRNQLSGFTASGASGQINIDPNANNDYWDHTLVSTSGAFTSYYTTDVDNRGAPLPGMSAIYGGDGPVMPSQTFADRVYLNNNGALPWQAGSILCTAIDNKTQTVTALAGTPDSAVRNFSYYGNLGVDYAIEYGTGIYNTVLDQKKATCRDIDSPGGWTTDIRNVPGGAEAVSKVRVRALTPIPGGWTWDIAVNIKARNTYLNTTTQIPIGTRLIQNSSFYIPNYPGVYQGEPGMPTDWFAGFYQADTNYYVGWGDRLTLTRAIVRIDKQNVPNQPTITATAGSQVTFVLKSTITAGVNPPPVSPDVLVQDILPATMNYIVGSASLVPTSVVKNPDGTTGCPSTNADVTAIRINALAFNTGAPTRKLTLNIIANSNNPNDIYSNRFTGRANGLLGLLISNDVYSRVRVPSQVLLSKRITAINGTAIASEVLDTTTTEDKNPNWPAHYLKGAIDGGKVKPGDELEYTIYFLNTGDNNATNIKICDRLQPQQSFQLDKYATGSGIQFKLGLDPVLNLTNIVDPIDRGQFIVADNNPLPSTCNLPAGTINNNGAIVIDVTGANGTGNPALVKMPGATAPGTPSNSYGYIRFTTKVDR